MRVCDWIADFLYQQGVVRVHGLMGGGASGLNDGFIKQGKINYICYHNEQGAGHAAIGESKFTGKIAVVNPTTGCAGTNCATSVLDAWQDSVPVIFISGNVRKDTCSRYINKINNTRLRKYGVQEHDVIETYRSMTKLSYFIQSPLEVERVFKHAWHEATTGRPGPVWIDIPSDVQTAPMPPLTYSIDSIYTESLFNVTNFNIKKLIEDSQRPLILAGYGIRQSNCVDLFTQFIEKYQLPYVSTYGARDYTDFKHDLNIGSIGIKGSRSGNFALQNADFLLILGSSLNSSVVGYNPTQFSPGSYKVLIDCDKNELEKDIIKIDEKYQIELPKFFREFL